VGKVSPEEEEMLGSKGSTVQERKLNTSEVGRSTKPMKFMLQKACIIS